MAFNIIYFLILLAYGIWLVGVISKNEIVVIASCLLLFPLSIYIFVNGMDIFNNLLTQMFAAITFIIAAYFSFLATSSLYGGT